MLAVLIRFSGSRAVIAPLLLVWFLFVFLFLPHIGRCYSSYAKRASLSFISAPYFSPPPHITHTRTYTATERCNRATARRKNTSRDRDREIREWCAWLTCCCGLWDAARGGPTHFFLSAEQNRKSDRKRTIIQLVYNYYCTTSPRIYLVEKKKIRLCFRKKKSY